MSEEKKRDQVEEQAEAPTETPVEEGATEFASCIDRLQRLQAEFENYKKRKAREISTLEDRIVDQVLLEFLVPYENLERAFRSYATDQNVEAFVDGVERIFAQFSRILDQRGVERIPSVGVPFDPALHEALLMAPSEEEKNTIIEEFSPGYRRDGRVLRVSRVSVSQGPAAGEETT
jgi:molecular chaperone GrpE